MICDILDPNSSVNSPSGGGILCPAPRGLGPDPMICDILDTDSSMSRTRGGRIMCPSSRVGPQFVISDERPSGGGSLCPALEAGPEFTMLTLDASIEYVDIRTTSKTRNVIVNMVIFMIEVTKNSINRIIMKSHDLCIYKRFKS
ncbi:hypothetical protein Hanom_Chr00s000007g01614791 [Helianthus anomalus]